MLREQLSVEQFEMMHNRPVLCGQERDSGRSNNSGDSNSPARGCQDKTLNGQKL